MSPADTRTFWVDVLVRSAAVAVSPTPTAAVTVRLQVAVAVLVESGGDRNNLEATGGQVAAPIGRAVIRLDVD